MPADKTALYEETGWFVSIAGRQPRPCAARVFLAVVRRVIAGGKISVRFIGISRNGAFFWRQKYANLG